MKKLLKKSIPLFMAGLLFFESIIPVFATVVDEHTTHQHEDTLQTEVTYTQESKFEVKLPKLIDLGSDKLTKYYVSVSGDISSDEIINVIPEESFSMKDMSGGENPKEDIIASVLQDKTEWIFNEFDIIGNGEVSAPGLTAGNWQGTFFFNISIDNIKNNPLSLMVNDVELNFVAIGTGTQQQITASIEGEDITDLIEWESSNEVITVENGLIETTAAAKVGDSSVITATYDAPSVFSMFSEGQTYSNSITVTIIDIVYTEVGGSEIITEIDIIPGESKEIEATIIPNSANRNLSWVTTATAGINLISNNNKVTIKVAKDMPIGESYYVSASTGSYIKLIKVNIVPDHYCDYEETVITAATCTTDGLASYKCKICESTYEETISAAGHIYSDWITSLNPTCTVAGSQNRTCSVCNEVESKELVALGHSWENDYTIDKAANCTENGQKSIHCTKCSVIKDVTSIPATGHTYSDWTTSLNPTCTTIGSQNRTCSVCNEVESKELAALGHSWKNDYTIDKAATCTTDGSKSIHCTKCSVIKDVTSIPATGHKSTNGGTQTVHTKCSVCGITLSSTHSYTSSVTTAATCTTNGVRTYTCGCGYKYTETIAATGHKSVNGGTSGVHTKCSTCGTTLSTTHSYTVDSGVQYSAATCTTARYNYKQCSCGYNPKSSSYTVAYGSSLGHNLVAGECSRCTYNVPGLYDANGNLLANWYSTGINVSVDISYPGQSVTNSAEYIITKNYPNTTKVILPTQTKIGQFQFYYCTKITNFVIPSSYTTIGGDAFSQTPWLATKRSQNPLVIINNILIDAKKTSGNVTIPSTVKTIAAYAFYGNSNLTGVTIPTSVTKIDHSAFRSCSKLTSITIPSSVTSIGSSCFYSCDSLTKITFADTTTWYIGSTEGEATTQIGVTNASTNAIYFKDTYDIKYWTKK